MGYDANTGTEPRRRHRLTGLGHAQRELDGVREQLASKVREIAALKEALAPFANLASWPKDERVFETVTATLKWSDLDRARSAHEGKT